VFDWIFEGKLSVYIVLGSIAFLFFCFWVQNRKRIQLVVAGIALALLGVYWLLDRAVETEREAIENTVHRMAASVAQKKLDIAFNHISERFRSPSDRTKENFRELADTGLASGQVTAVDVWGFEFPERPDRARESKVRFNFKVRGELGGKEAFYYVCDAVFVYESPGVWRLLRCRILDPVHVDEEIGLPGF
jgi:hypothetical protein